MFRCAVTGKVSKPREQQIKVVIQSRPRVYEYRNKDGELLTRYGEETIREIACSAEGYETLKKNLEMPDMVYT